MHLYHFGPFVAFFYLTCVFAFLLHIMTNGLLFHHHDSITAYHSWPRCSCGFISLFLHLA
uniref:Uncharacterized protein n=1 Tax=Arundo donax TaxID=35708 RepID=A0A0A9E4P1_ARUDO